MAKRTVELQDFTGPFTVKVIGDTEGVTKLVISSSVMTSKDLYIDLQNTAEIENLGLMLQNMAEDIAKELSR